MTDAANARRADPELDEAETLDAVARSVVEACDGDPMAAVRALLASNTALELEVARLSNTVSTGYTRGRAKAR